MKREIKISLIVFGSLFVLVVVAVIALAVVVARYGPELARNASDPVVARRTAAKIATFEVPKGYRIASATDLTVSQTVTIESANPGGDRFRIQLQGTRFDAGGDSQLTGARAGASIVGRFLDCNLKDDGTDVVRVRGVDVGLAVMTCTGPHGPMRIETGAFPGNAMSVTLTAIGIGKDAFDRTALHALLRSVR